MTLMTRVCLSFLWIGLASAAAAAPREHKVFGLKRPHTSFKVSKPAAAVPAPVVKVSAETPPPPPPPEPLAPKGPQPDLTVTVTGGQIGGQRLDDGSYVFKAVPFAQAPVGDKRWTPPQAVASWDGVRYATDSAPACLQADYGWQTDMAAKSAEDCLYLELRAPEPKARPTLPVMVFIHGGANRAGGGAGTVMSGLSSKGVVVVSLQYRLGVFGFLSHPALTKESEDKASGNYAVMDLVAALQWVRDNIEKFGGDPENVTIFGHSAGAQDVGLLMASPLAKGLFHKAIIESGPPQFGLPPRSLKDNEALGVDLARQYAQNAHAPDSAEALADLRHAPALALQQSADKLKPPIDDAGFIWLQAVVDGHVLPRSPADVFRAHDQAKVPLIIGTSATELGLYGGEGAIYSTIHKAFGDQRLRVLRFYGLDVETKAKADPVLGDVAMQLSTDLMMRCPSDWTAAKVTASAQKAWMYQLDMDSNGGVAHHSSELAFVFNDRPKSKSPEAWPPLIDLWARFATTGDPNGRGLPVWDAYGRAGNYIEFAGKGPAQHQGMRAPVCALRDTP